MATGSPSAACTDCVGARTNANATKKTPIPNIHPGDIEFAFLLNMALNLQKTTKKWPRNTAIMASNPYKNNGKSTWFFHTCKSARYEIVQRCNYREDVWDAKLSAYLFSPLIRVVSKGNSLLSVKSTTLRLNSRSFPG